MANTESARRAEKELDAKVVVIPKTSPEYSSEKNPPVCPSVFIDSKPLVINGTVTFENLADAIKKEN
ncbi:MAG: hypothetical protein HQL10_10190 [Nitrospirae bacterium]|nr:hypothetical protein [Nitrospirota bacterium]